MLSCMCDKTMILKTRTEQQGIEILGISFHEIGVESILWGCLLCCLINPPLFSVLHTFLIKKRLIHFFLGATNIKGLSVRKDDIVVSIDVHEACIVLFRWVSV